MDRLNFNLKERANLGLNFLSRNVDPSLDFQPYFFTDFSKDPPENRHCWPDFGDLTGRYVDAFILARLMTGSKQGAEVEQGLKRLLLSYFSEGDGLSYRPKNRAYISGESKQVYREYVAEGFDQAKTLLGLTTWYLFSGDKKVKKCLDKMVLGLWRIAIKKNKIVYYSQDKYLPGYSPQPDEPPTPNLVYYGGVQIFPLVRYYEMTGNEIALALASGLSNFIVNYLNHFGKDGSFGGADIKGHTHSNIGTVVGILRYARLTGDRKLFSFAKKVYDWFKTKGSKFGWFPEWIHPDPTVMKHQTCETCTIVDMIDAAIHLAEAGFPEYWQDVERFVRNQLWEQQLVDTSFMKSTKKKRNTKLSCFSDVPQMVKGGFSGWSDPNDLIGGEPPRQKLMNCCGPSGIHALYSVWQHILTKENDGLNLNLFFNRDTRWAKVNSRLPFEGKITVQILMPIPNFRIRWPSPEIKIEEVSLKVNGWPRKIILEQGYLLLEQLSTGDEIEFVFPLKTEVKLETINSKDYRVTWRGDTVIGISPPGKRVPLYQGRNIF